ncbi:MAG: toprim domain-containing protein [Eubacteriales bacterium]
MLKISRPIIVEGKYDRLKVLSVAEAKVITTDGFGIFSKTEKAAFLHRLAEKNGVIVITDSDGAGLVIRNHLKNILPPDKIINIYTPEIPGKEKRKKVFSKAGLLGLEGMSAEWLTKALAPFSDDAESVLPHGENELSLTKADFYALGFSGTEGSAEKRKRLAQELSLPTIISCDALIYAINTLVPRDEFYKAAQSISGDKNG